MKNRLAFTGLVLACLSSAAQSDINRQELGGFIDEMVAKHNFERAELSTLFEGIELRQSIIDAITRPAEGLPWHKYRAIFLTPARIEGGAQFWKTHADTLVRAEQVYGVPAEIIVAIIGVETNYGKNTGSYRVIDALATLAFNYPKRAEFFRSELEQYLLLTEEENVDPLAIKGSYAGAMGLPQFISSSYRHYAVDFDNDGQRDLWNNTSDAIGSVANYLSEHGWQRGVGIAFPVEVSSGNPSELADQGLKPELSLGQLKNAGVDISSDVLDSRLGTLLELEAVAGMEYWVGLHNFYMITRYNHSSLYAMAVYQLSQEIKEAMASSTSPG